MYSFGSLINIQTDIIKKTVTCRLPKFQTSTNIYKTSSIETEFNDIFYSFSDGDFSFVSPIFLSPYLYPAILQTVL